MNLTYCAVDEAFDNPMRQQMQRMVKENNINNHKASITRTIEDYQNKNGLTPPHQTTKSHIIEGYINERKYPNSDIPFFTAQGDYNSTSAAPVDFDSQDDKGTTISELKRQEDDSIFDESVSLLDSNYSNLIVNDKIEKVKLGHNYCINKFLKSITDDGSDVVSLASSQDDQVYDHIKSCKYCRSQINQKMKRMYGKKIETFTDGKQEVPIIPPKSVSEEVFGYKMKEIIIIITVSIMIIFILDLLVRIGRKT
jgi:hypothetical protein